MLKFNPEDLRCIYVYILKVTADYVYVTTTRAGARYKENSSLQDNYRGYKVSKLSIHRAVANSYRSLFSRTEFDQPWLASLNYYGDEILSIEIQQKNSRTGEIQKPENWRSAFSRSITSLNQHIIENVTENTYVNGSEVFWPVAATKADRELYSADSDKVNRVRFLNDYEMSVSTDNSLTIREVQYVALENLGLSLHRKISNGTKKLIDELSEKDISEEDIALRINELEESVYGVNSLSFNSGKVMTYYPDYKNNPDISVFSPVIRLNSKGKAESESTKDLLRKIFSLTNTNDPMFVSAEFAIKSAKVIGELYGYSETDFLDIQSIVVKSGQVNLHNIEEKSRLSYPTEIAPLHMIAYLFKFIYRENNLRNLRDLNNLVRFGLRDGFIHNQDLEGLLTEKFSGSVAHKGFSFLPHKEEMKSA